MRPLFKNAAVVVSLFLFSCGGNHPTSPLTESEDGSANVSIKVGAVGALAKTAKTADIAMTRLIVSLAAAGQTAINDTFPLAGTSSTTINKTYENLAPFVTWTLSAKSLDSRDSVIHAGFSTFTLQPRQMLSVSLNLDARYSMLKANFFPIRDSVTRCVLIADGAVKKDSSFAKQALLGDTVRLSFDYLQTGLAQRIKMEVYGVMWGLDTLLYTGDTLIMPVAGVNANYNITLKWVGPAQPPRGQATMTVTLGAVGTVTVNGNLEGPILQQPVKIIAVDGGGEHSLILLNDGSLWACGWNRYGQLGTGDTISKMKPVQVFKSGVKGMGTVGWHSLIVKEDGSFWAFGMNNYGQIGNGNYIDQRTPVQILSSGVKSVESGVFHSLIVKNDGSLWGCGLNINGQIGIGNTSSTSTLTQVVGSSVKGVAAGGYHSLIVKADGSLWACGLNSWGQLGTGDTVSRKTPVQVLSSGVESAAAGIGYSLIIKTDGTLWGCGSYGSGELGLTGQSGIISNFVQISSNVRRVSAGDVHTLILKNDGSLWGCGYNGFGRLGLGNTTNLVTPTQILSSGVQDIGTGGAHSLIIKVDGSLWVCGWNLYGQLGDGTTVDKLVPTQISLP
jgi:alpha-tubulin suppressor-like RCC1 family protein